MPTYEHILISTHTDEARSLAKKARAKIVAIELDGGESFLAYLLGSTEGTHRLIVCDTPPTKSHPHGKWLVVDVPYHQIVRIKERGEATV